jgi:phosphatidylglycerol---prolipoprotein diacylglyceryl transferase
MIEFHWYGFVVGLAVVTGILSVEFAVKKWLFYSSKTLKNNSQKEYLSQLWQVLIVITFFAVIGARVWHGVTDFHLYQQNLVGLLWINQGGLSILGAVLGGALGVLVFSLLKRKQKVAKNIFWFDLLVLGLPISQIIGRFGNWINQEVYGLPSSLPWAIFIDLPHRVAGFENFSKYHPLFLYEILLLLPLVMISWLIFFKKPNLVGSGLLVCLYGTWYGLGRFFLEFLRIDKTKINLVWVEENLLSINQFGLIQLGVNQLALLAVGLVSLVLLLNKIKNLQIRIN